MKRVSIVIPVYNAAAYLPACLESVCGQTYGDLDIVCSYDDSCDNSLDILQDFAGHDKRIRILTHGAERPCSPAYNRNAGLDAADGEFVRFVDSDDLIPPESTSLLVNSMGCDHDAVRGTLEYRDEAAVKIKDVVKVTDKNRSGVSPLSEEYGVIDKLLYGHYAYLFRLAFLRKHNIRYATQLRVGEDLVFLRRALFRLNLLAMIPESVYCYRLREDSEMTGKKTYGWFHNIISTYRITYQLAAEHDLMHLADRYLLLSLNTYLGKDILPLAMTSLTVAEQDSLFGALQSLLDEYAVLHRLKKHDIARLGVEWNTCGQALLISIWMVDYDTAREILLNKSSCMAKTTGCESLRCVKNELNAIYNSRAWKLSTCLRTMYRMLKR